MKKFASIAIVLASVTVLSARQEQRSCASHPDKWREELRLHLSADISQAKARLAAGDKPATQPLPDLGNIAHLDESDGVIARRNPFNLNLKTLRFVPVGNTQKYRYELAADTYDTSAAQAGTLLSGIGDDDSREVTIPFAFPFFGTEWRSVHINSDGNVSFGAGDVAVTDRSLGRFLAGPPRIAALFRDLDPTKATTGIKILSEPNRVVISWVAVPEYRDSGTGPLETFQLRLFSDGKIELAYSGASTTDAIAGITPGGMWGDPSIISFLNGTTGTEYTSSVAERFSGSESVDIFAAAQKFYRNHDDSYDYLVIYNNLGIAADVSAVAYEVTVRNQRSGYGDVKTDVGEQAGSQKRLQAILNMGPLTQYPTDPNSRVPARFSVGDTPLSVLAHETGHLFLAYASIVDELGNKPLLGAQMAHWDFKFNSEASLLEGNRIQDNGAGASPRFLTTGTVEGFAPLDQYLMGFIPPEAVPSTFYVANARGPLTTGLPRVGVAFDGDRRNVSVSDIIDAEGRRIPDNTVSQRKFRFAFLIVTASGETPTTAQMSQLDTYRLQFEPYFQRVTTQNAVAETTLKKAVHVSSFPAIGVVQGGTAGVNITLDQETAVPLAFGVTSASGLVGAPQSVSIPVGALQATFQLTGTREGVDNLSVEPQDPGYESSTSRVQVLPANRLQLTVLSYSSPLQIKVTDVNELPYPGVSVQARANGGSLDQNAAVSDADGKVEFRQNGAVSEIAVGINNGPSITISPGATPVFSAGSVVNAASFAPGIVPGEIASIFGTRLGGSNAQVLLNGKAARLFFGNDGQLNFLVPLDLTASSAQLSVEFANSASSAITVPVLPVQPGIFFDTANGFGAVTLAGTGQLTSTRPVQAGDYIEIYTTGLGRVVTSSTGLRETVVKPQVTIGGVPAEISYSGLAPGFSGLYQINARVPSTPATGAQPLVVTSAGIRSNEVKIQLR